MRSLGGCSGGKRQAGSSYCTCTLDQPSPARDDGLIQTRFVARVGCGMPRQHFRRIGSPPSQAIDQGLTLHLDIAASLAQNFLTPSIAQPGTTGKSFQQEKKKKERRVHFCQNSPQSNSLLASQQISGERGSKEATAEKVLMFAPA